VSTVRVTCVAGARPNYVKVKPVMDAIEERGVEVIPVRTFTPWVDSRCRGWRLLDVTQGPGSGPGRADFFGYARATTPAADGPVGRHTIVTVRIRSTTQKFMMR
jgi:UDP-N-acetylglucosamine 2-epimerase (non-hydrolysing)